VSSAIDLLRSFDPLASTPPGSGEPGAFAAPGEAPASEPRARRYVLLDVFSDSPLQGNQLAVFTDGRALSGELMQRVARELNLSETVFVTDATEPAAVAIRIFTPGAELPFAGHPVLGSAIVIGAALGLREFALQTRGGPVPVRIEHERGLIWNGSMDQPIPTWAPYDREPELLSALGLERSELPVEVYDNGPRHVYVCLPGEQAVAALAPDLHALSMLGEVCVSCFAGSGARFKTRMFAPALGVAEDPATGSAAGPLAVHLCRHGAAAFGEEIEIRQGAEIARPSLLRARVLGSAQGIDRVQVGGAAVIIGRGDLLFA
jgi:trans-2,3-dihydro-3-hydroxyanthranilate isomerase